MNIHVADVDFESLYAEACVDTEKVRAFVRCVRKLNANECAAKIALHRAGRLVWLADQMGGFAAKRPGLSIAFLTFAAEAVAKLVNGFEKEGQSRKFVHMFFSDICSNAAKDELESAFSRIPDEFLEGAAIAGPVVDEQSQAFNFRIDDESAEKIRSATHLTLEEAVDYLYEIRCTVVHEGSYTSFCLRDDEAGMFLATYSKRGVYMARISLEELRRIVLAGALQGALNMLPHDSPCRALLEAPNQNVAG